MRTNNVCVKRVKKFIKRQNRKRTTGSTGMRRGESFHHEEDTQKEKREERGGPMHSFFSLMVRLMNLSVVVVGAFCQFLMAVVMGGNDE